MGLIIPIALGFRFRQIARRANHERLIKSTRLWLLLFSICAPATVLSPGIVFLVSKLLPGSEGVLVAGVVPLLFVVFIDFVLYIQAIFGLAEFRKLLRRADTPASRRRPSE